MEWQYLVSIIIVFLVVIAIFLAIFPLFSPESTLIKGLFKIFDIGLTETADKEKEQTLRQEAFDSVTNLFGGCKSKKKDLCVCTGKEKIFIPNAYFLFSQPADGLRIELIGEQGMSMTVKDASLCYVRKKSDISDMGKTSIREKRVYMTGGEFYVEEKAEALFGGLVPPGEREELVPEHSEREYMANPFVIVKNTIAGRTYLCLLPSTAIGDFGAC